METTSLPVEWWSWLHGSRDDIPTKEELMASALKREQLKQRVAKIDAEDKKQRLRQLVDDQSSLYKTDDDFNENPNDVVQSLHLLVKNSANRDVNRTNMNPVSTSAPIQTPGQTPTSKSAPQPPPSSSSSEFQPSSWQPNDNKRRKK
eukprot:CAMPEP_0182446088 /NCGR_PEP_ID=MMETSP1172-20130603/3984_1 /TAXON_ID=708627 /ORGANISM="Timspurckia oligopyrenoides, Strain CCMP3278" /LENGTH=146 /DNA_ID=CAMNT_0024641969 /DNA_START=233 /DNA_END=673 /DNA_ORIENTATION=+